MKKFQAKARHRLSIFKVKICIGKFEFIERFEFAAAYTLKYAKFVRRLMILEVE